MKKIAALFLVAVMTFALFAESALAASDFSVSLKEYSGDVTFSGNTNGAYAVALVDVESQTVLYQKNFREQIEPASTTKILTLLIALEQGNMDDEVTIKSSETSTELGGPVGGSKLGIKSSEKIKLKDLLNGMMMASGNDAAVAVADHIAGSVEDFAVMMNAKAKDIGMTHSNFVTPHGMHNDDHYTTAEDMAILTLYAMQNPVFVQIVGQSSYDMPADNKHSGVWNVKNTNKLMQPDNTYYYQYATGIKTGSTTVAGDCLVSSASKNGMNLICLVYKVNENDPVRWTMTKDLFEWGFENFETVDLASLITSVESVQATVEDASAGDSGVLEFNKPDAGAVFVTLPQATIEAILDDPSAVQADAVYNTETLQAPITKDDVLGTLTYKFTTTGETIYQCNLIASRDVVKAGTEPNSSGATAVETQTPVEPTQIKTPKDNSLVWLWLLLPAGLIAFLVIRVMNVNKRKRKRFKPRQPHYSYKIRK